MPALQVARQRSLLERFAALPAEAIENERLNLRDCVTDIYRGLDRLATARVAHTNTWLFLNTRMRTERLKRYLCQPADPARGNGIKEAVAKLAAQLAELDDAGVLDAPEGSLAIGYYQHEPNPALLYHGVDHAARPPHLRAARPLPELAERQTHWPLPTMLAAVAGMSVTGGIMAVSMFLLPIAVAPYIFWIAGPAVGVGLSVGIWVGLWVGRGPSARLQPFGQGLR